MSEDRTRILGTKEIDQKITRMAHEIYERHYKSGALIIVGIKGEGAVLAQRLSKILKNISPLEITDMELSLDKKKPLNTAVLSGELSALKSKRIILVDDVLNSGRTLIYAVSYLLESGPKSLGTAVLVDRIHRTFPIRADYVGMTLSTNLKEHISVEFWGKSAAAYLD